VQLPSKGRYHVMVTSADGGYSSWRDLAITRWREDVRDEGIEARTQIVVAPVHLVDDRQEHRVAMTIRT
jgi:hypothetical protein